jgi:hypothetical protein
MPTGGRSSASHGTRRRRAGLRCGSVGVRVGWRGQLGRGGGRTREGHGTGVGFNPRSMKLRERGFPISSFKF